MASDELTVEQKGQNCALYKANRELCPQHDGKISQEEARAQLDAKARLESAETKLKELASSTQQICQTINQKSILKTSTSNQQQKEEKSDPSGNQDLREIVAPTQENKADVLCTV